MRRTVLTTAGLALSAALALTACGSEAADKPSDKGADTSRSTTQSKKPEPFADASGPEIAEQAMKATGNAKSLRIKGTVPDEEMGAITLDMAMDRGGSCAGSMSVGGGGRAEIVNDGKTVYMKYDEAFLRAQTKDESEAEVDAAVEMLGDRWLKTSATGDGAEDLEAFCDLDQLLAEFTGGTSSVGKGERTTVDGQEAITLTEKNGKDTYSMYVATEGKPYILRVTDDGAEDGENLVFTDYDKPVDAKAPTGDVLDLDAL
ncbi:hypothetical protein [Streptomyces sp. KLOTTS4A1]|uniref:hypothetical protein n=1 Tax=Streptomyces sp. KLOTTS4A1 TaxID=3390996 RepID=UPI0039F630A1